jgi:hypothetical protein
MQLLCLPNRLDPQQHQQYTIVLECTRLKDVDASAADIFARPCTVASVLGADAAGPLSACPSIGCTVPVAFIVQDAAMSQLTLLQWTVQHPGLSVVDISQAKLLQPHFSQPILQLLLMLMQWFLPSVQ